MNTDPFERDRWGRPIIDNQPYQRISTFAKTLSDQGGLTEWLAWKAVQGAILDPALARQVADSPRAPKDLLEGLREKANANAAATKGTMRHQLLAMRLNGEPLPDMSPAALAEIEQLADVISELGTLRGTEVPIVNDQWKVAGSADYWITGPDGRPVVADFKTGKRVNRLECGIQLVSYARGRVWDGTQRREWIAAAPPALVVIHAPQNKPGKVQLHRIDPVAATRWAEHAHVTKQIRKEEGEVA